MPCEIFLGSLIVKMIDFFIRLTTKYFNIFWGGIKFHMELKIFLGVNFK